LEKRPIPDVGDGDVLVRVLVVGICAGDAKCYAGVPYFWGTEFVYIFNFNKHKKHHTPFLLRAYTEVFFSFVIDNFWIFEISAILSV